MTVTQSCTCGVWGDMRLYEYCSFLSTISVDQPFLHAHRAIKLLRKMCGKDNYTYGPIQCQGFHLSSVQFECLFVSSSTLGNAVCKLLLNNFIIQQENKSDVENIVSKQLNGFTPEDRIIVLQSLWNISECNWPLHELLETVIEEAPKLFEDIIFSIVEEMLNEKNEVQQLWLHPYHIKLIIASTRSKKLFFYIVNVLSRITLFFMLNSRHSRILNSIMKGFITHVKNMCNNMNIDFVFIFPRDLQALVLLLETDLELYIRICYPLPSVKKLLHGKLKSHSLNCFAVFIYFREWLFHLYHTNTYDYV